FFFFFSSRRRHTRSKRDWSSDVCSSDLSMAETAENVAEDYQVTRADQDAFALRSQQRAARASAAGYFADEIVPVDAPGGKAGPRSEERRVGKEGRAGWGPES